MCVGLGADNECEGGLGVDHGCVCWFGCRPPGRADHRYVVDLGVTGWVCVYMMMTIIIVTIMMRCSLRLAARRVPLEQEASGPVAGCLLLGLPRPAGHRRSGQRAFRCQAGHRHGHVPRRHPQHPLPRLRTRKPLPLPRRQGARRRGGGQDTSEYSGTPL